MSGRVGVLLVNLGTPEAPSPRAVRAYLREFLSDRRVVELPRLLWRPLLELVLAVRSRRSARLYRQVWTDAGSPLAVITARQAAALVGALGPQVIVDHAMRYGRRSIAARIDALIEAGCDRLLLAPLYPQYSAATTASAYDAACTQMRRLRHQPAQRMLPPYFADPAYIQALKASVEAQLATLGFEPQAIVASFHSMPERTRRLGDPYRDQCLETARLLSLALGRELVVAFQSRFGRAKWLGPATAETLAGLPARGVTRVAVVAPGFAADCLETLEELAIRGRFSFLAAGGSHFACLACLNDSEPGLDMLHSLIGRELEGWQGAQ
ncbi:MAG: ferrochelatase [Sphingosinicella sp.]